MLKYVRKPWNEIKRLPVWVKWQGGVRLTWWPKHGVVGIFPRCENCSIWYAPTARGSPGRCVVCTSGDTHTLTCAASVIREALSLLVWVVDDDEKAHEAVGETGTA